MKKILILWGFLGGCSSDQTSDDSQLPWNRPASWERRRDISTSLQFHRAYKPEDFNENPRDNIELEVKFDDEKTKVKLIQEEPDYFEKMRWENEQIILPVSPRSHLKNRRISKQPIVEVTKEYPEEPNPYNFNSENSNLLQNIDH